MGNVRRLIPVALLVALLALIGWRVVQKNAKANAGNGPQAGGGRGGRRGGGPTSVEVATAGPRTIETVVQAVGTAASPQTVRLSPPVSGRITFLEAREGDRVTAGAVLARIDPSQIEGTVLQAQSAVAEAQARLAQAEATIGSQSVALQSAIGTGAANVTGAQAALDQARKTQRAQVAAAQAVVTQQAASARASEAAVASAKAQEEAARGTLRANQVKLERIEGLFKGGYIAAQDVDDAKAAAATSLGGVRVAQQAAATARAQVAQAKAQQAAARAQVVVAQRETAGAILTARSNLRSAQATLRSANANTAQGQANLANLAALRSAVQAARGTLAAAQAQRANTELRSPIDGTVTLRGADPGTLAQPGTPVLTIQVLKRIFVESSFPVELASQIKAGEEASVAFDSLPDHKYLGRIFDVNRAADPTSRQFTVRVQIDNPGETIRPGMFGEVTVVTSRTPAAVTVPLNALTEQDGKATVTVVGEDGTASVRDVTAGARDTVGAQVVRGVRAGERVVVEKARAVKDGQKVTVVDAGAKPRGGKGRKR